MKIFIDGNQAIKRKNQLWRGLGMVSGNNSSRLLIDYKWEHSDKYWEILNHIFGKNGIGINHLKIEMGSDINSSSGTEPAIKRSLDEKPDITRGAGFILAADAKKINPDLTLDMLWWSEPLWIEKSDDIYSARYLWYKENLTAAYEKFNIKFDYISATQNERAWDFNWIKYLANKLKNEKNSPYDFSKIKIVAGEEVCTWWISEAMVLWDKSLNNCIDVIGSHYTSWSTGNTKFLQLNGKEVWFSEGSSPMKDAEQTCRFDINNSGLAGINGVLDIANRIITMYAQGGMTLFEFQPVVNSYYDGVTYCCKQLITANEPWSGYYKLDAGYFMCKHFSQFFPKGWSLINEACCGDGKKGGDGHAIVEAKFNYLTACNPETKDFSTIICNSSTENINYEICIENLKNNELYIWETRGPDKISDSYDSNYFKKINKISSEQQKLELNVKPLSIVTVSTLNIEENKFIQTKQSELLKLPYYDDFKYSSYPNEYLEERGYMPRFTTDEGGAFEIIKSNQENLLQQKITLENKAREWGWTSEPVTNLGDDRWFNYSVSAEIKFSQKAENNSYAGIGLRYNLPDQGHDGWWIQLFKNGEVCLNHGNNKLFAKNISSLQEWNLLKISAFNKNISFEINGIEILNTEYSKLNCILPGAGRAALFSSYDTNLFRNLKIEPLDSSYYIKRFNDTDLCFDYQGNWEHSLLDSFKYYKRTVSFGSADNNCSFTCKFTGCGINITGTCETDCIVEIQLDNKVIDNRFPVNKGFFRDVLLSLCNLKYQEHLLSVKIIKGSLKINSAEIMQIENYTKNQ